MTRENNKVNNTTTLWTYDELGNISAKTEYAYTTGTPSTATKTVTYGYGKDSKSSWNNLLVSVDKNGNETTDTNETITYDAIGNPLTYLGATLTWNGRQLTSYKTDDKEITYTYNSNGIRASKIQKDYTVAEDGTKTLTKTTETKYYYVNGQLHFQDTLATNSDGTTVVTKLHFYYDSYGYLTGIKYNGTNYYVATNKRGDVVALYYYDGRIMGRYEYDAWGNVIKIEDIYYDSNGNQVTADLTNNTTSRDILVVNPIRYRSYYYDTETGLYYVSSRYYDLEIGRFINADSLIDNRGVITQNLFQYCGNNPVNNADPSGNLFGAIVGIGLLVIGMVATLSGCSSKPATTTSTPSTPSKPSTPSSSTSSTTPAHIPTPQEKSYAATVYAEAGGQNKRSKQAVAHVMNNRIGTRSSWTDIESVISAKYQFDGYNSPMYQAAMNYYNNGICNNSIEQAAMDECLAVVIPIYSGAEADITGGALYFHSFPNPSDWAYHNSYTQVYVSGTEKFWFYK